MEKAEDKAIALRALAAAAGAAGKFEGVCKALAESLIRIARSAVDSAEGPGKYEVANATRQARKAFATLTDTLLGASEQDYAASMAIRAAASACACYAAGDLVELRRLARNALRFATEASGGEVDWTVEEG